MFVKKFVEKAASRKQPVGCSIHGLKADDVNPRLAFHYGIPSGSSVMAFDPIHNILAISTNDGRIKLFGKDGTQALLQSNAAIPSKFLQFIENHGILLNINSQNHIEVWDIDKKELCYVHISSEEITSYAVLQQSLYMYIGNCHGDTYVMKLDEQTLVSMQYRIPFTESYGKMSEISDGNAVVGILPQPMSETMRVLILFRDGLVSLWDIQESKVAYTTGGITQFASHHEPKKAVAACWACPHGSKLVVGYSNGEIFVWAIPTMSDQKNVSTKSKKDFTPNVPLIKLNLGYKTDKVPIVSVKWVGGDGTASRLYVNGYSEFGSYSFQVVALNENIDSRTIKLVLPLAETCMAMEFISCFSYKTKHNQKSLLIMTKSGQLYIYNESQIEHYLLQCQSKSVPSLPSHFVVKLPCSDSSITAAKLYASYSGQPNIMDEEQLLLVKNYSNLFAVDKREKDANYSSFDRFTKTNSLYITGHEDGAVNIWDASCPLLLPIFSIKYQSDDSNSSIGFPVTALLFDISSQILVIGDQNGLARIITFKVDHLASDNIFSFLQAKQDGNYTSRNVKVKGTIQCISINTESTHLAIGTDKGFVFMFEMEGNTILYQKQFPSQLYGGTFSLQFENCSHNGYAKNVLLVSMQDSSISFIDEDTGSELNANVVHTKKPSRALLMEILVDTPSDGVGTSGSQLLFCSENAVRLYSLSHAVQGIKKVNTKKKLNGTCCFASIVHGPFSHVGIVLVFVSGKVEIRSLPDLSLLKDASVRGFPHSSLKSCPNTRNVICCASPEGELVVVNGDQEILFFSVSFQKEGIYRKLEHITQVYKDTVAAQEGSLSTTDYHKEKKKGIFSMVKDLAGNKSKHIQETHTDDSSVRNLEELSSTFSTVNFPIECEDRKNSIENEEDIDLDIDDIDLEDPKEKPKERSFGLLNKQKLGKKFQAIKGKLKIKMDEKPSSPKDMTEDDKGVGAVDQIKKKYGYAVNNESSTLKIAESKLRENAKKLQGINDRTSEMQDNAQSFSSMAKEVLRNVQK